MPETATLPNGFSDLLPFVPEWAGETAQERWEMRERHSMPEIRAFYDAILARSEDIIAHVDQFTLTELPPASLRLFQLQRTLAQAAMAVELHGQPRAPHSPYPHHVRILRGAQPVP